MFEVSGPFYSYSSPYGTATRSWDEYYICDRVNRKSIVIKDYGDRCSIVENNKIFRFENLLSALSWAEDRLEEKSKR